MICDLPMNYTMNYTTCTSLTPKLMVNLPRPKYKATNFNWKQTVLIKFSMWYSRLCFLHIPTQYCLASVPGNETNFYHQQCWSSEQLQVEAWILVSNRISGLHSVIHKLATCTSAFQLLTIKIKVILVFIPDFTHLIEF